MKRNIGPTTLVLLVFAMFVVSMASPSALAQQCSLAAAAGAYGFTGTGTLLFATGAVPIAAAGRLFFARRQTYPLCALPVGGDLIYAVEVRTYFGGRGVLALAVEVCHLRFQRTLPSRESSRIIPRSARILRMRSEAAKSRDWRAVWRSATSFSISASSEAPFFWP